MLNDLPTADPQAVKAKLAAKDVAFVAERPIPNTDTSAAYFSIRTVTNAQFLVELKFKAGSNLCKVTVKSPSKPLSEFVKAAVAKIISA